MNSVTLTGISPSEIGDDRTKLLLNVIYEDEEFQWVLRMFPTFTGTFQEYVEQNTEAVYADIAAKLQQWEDLDPKTRTIVDDITNETITVDITREEILVPTYPDYYILRAREYPPVSEQLDAFWKGGDAIEAMATTISGIKARYPKE
jgi:hypothetical protein